MNKLYCPTIPTTKSDTTIDAVFIGNLNNVQSKNYISYFSRHFFRSFTLHLRTRNTQLFFTFSFKIDKFV